MRHFDFDDEPTIVIEKSPGIGTFLLGLAVGAGLALLFAPESGEATRRRISRKVKQARDAAEDAVGEVTDRVGDTFEAARQRVEEKIDEARSTIEMKKEQVQRAMQAGREAAEQAREDLERRLAETKAAYSAGARVAREVRGGGARAGSTDATSTTGAASAKDRGV